MNENILEIIGHLGKAAFSSIEVRCDLTRDDLRERLRNMRNDGLIEWTGHSYVLTDTGAAWIQIQQGKRQYGEDVPETDFRDIVDPVETTTEIELCEPEITIEGPVDAGIDRAAMLQTENQEPLIMVENTINHYQAAIDILMDCSARFDLLCAEIAKKYPKTICDAAEAISERRNQP